MMTRHDFEAIAEVVRRFTTDYPDQGLQAEWWVTELEEIFYGSNPRFDGSRFRAACGVE